MCLYPRAIKNPKYRINKKNGGILPEMKDQRVQYVPVGCGNCIECRKQKANAWKIRLIEEIKDKKYKYFVTLTFSEENLNKIANKVNSNDSEIIATYAVRHFLERWRKKHKKSLKHWLITELGHKNTERLHLHGILITDSELSKSKLLYFWKYGRVDNGVYCNSKSIGYITKYVTKIDIKHKGFIGKIFCSPGIGKNYITEEQRKAHQYEPNNTNELYCSESGQKYALPIYYRNKFFNEEEREDLWLERIKREERWVRGIHIDVSNKEGERRYFEVLKQAQEDNKKMGYGDNSKEWKKRPYKAKL